MLGNIVKILTVGALGFGAKKIYDAVKSDKSTKEEKEEYVSSEQKEWERWAQEEADKEPDLTMRMMKAASPRLFEKDDFYQELKNKLPKGSQNWDNKKKNEFIQVMLSKFEGAEGWDYIRAEDALNIFELTKTKGKTLDCLRFVAETFPGLTQTDRVVYIIKEVERIRERQAHPLYDLNQKPSVEFKDIGFKLAVINQLMFQNKTLKPQFSLDLFREEYHQHFISKLRGASKEAADYMRNLDIPLHLLDKLTTLEINPTSELYKMIYIPKKTDFGDMFITKRQYFTGTYIPLFSWMYCCDNKESIQADLALLPNLKEISINLTEMNLLTEKRNKTFQDLGFTESVLDILKEKNIKVVLN